MKTCRAISILLVGHGAGELSEFERHRVEAHLATCRACRDELARERRLCDRLRALPPVRCPDRVTARIAAAVDRDERRRRVSARWRRYVPAAAALAAAILLVVAWPPPGGTPPVEPAAVAAADAAAAGNLNENDLARDEVVRALVFTATVIDRAERRVRDDLLRLLQPAIQAAGSLDTAPASPGGRG